MYNNLKTITESEDRQYESLVRLLRKQTEQLEQIQNDIKDILTKREALVGQIQLDTITLEIILEVSESTLYRWRAAAPPYNLPYYIRKNGSLYYDFDEVLQAIRKGRLQARGFNRFTAIDNLMSYRDDLYKSKCGKSAIVIETA